MRLLLVSDTWYPQLNGVVRALSKTCELLEERGRETVVLGPDRFKNVPAPSYPEVRLALCTPGRVGRIIDETRPDAVHIATGIPRPLLLASAWSGTLFFGFPDGEDGALHKARRLTLPILLIQDSGDPACSSPQMGGSRRWGPL